MATARGRSVRGRQRVVDIDRGYRKLMARAGVGVVRGRFARVVKVGWQGAAAAELVDAEGAINLVHLAAVHEFGRLDGSIPERSMIRAYVDEHRAELQALVRKLARQVVLQRLTEDRALRLLGEHVKNGIQARIEAGIDPPLSETTLQLKEAQGKIGPPAGSGPQRDARGRFVKRGEGANGGAVPLIDTGRMKNAITYAVE